MLIKFRSTIILYKIFLSTNDNDLQRQVDVIATILQTLEDKNINTNLFFKLN